GTFCLPRPMGADRARRWAHHFVWRRTAMSALQHVCFVHGSREAVALCVECRNFFCRECVVDHDGRLTCAACLAQRREKPRAATGAIGSVLRAAAVFGALLLCWMLFYMGG